MHSMFWGDITEVATKEKRVLHIKRKRKFGDIDTYREKMM